MNVIFFDGIKDGDMFLLLFTLSSAKNLYIDLLIDKSKDLVFY